MDVTAIIVAIIGSGILNTLLGFLLSIKKKKSGVEQGLRLIMKDRLRFLCKFYVQQGWIYEDELEDLTAMHQCYHNELKGNGFLDNQMRRINELEIRGIGVK